MAINALLSLVINVLLLIHHQHQVAAQPSNMTRPPAVIVFGDSIVDPGNNNAIVTTIKCDFPPYGKDFVGQQATGRFSNGRVPGDIIGKRLHTFPNHEPPSLRLLCIFEPPCALGVELDAQDLLTGVSFASGGCGYDPLTAELVSVLTMDDQLKLFKEYKEKIKTIAGEEKADYIISQSLYLVVTGTDDLANTYFTTPFRSVEYDLASYIKYVVQEASKIFQELYSLGARKLGITGSPPIGCLPSQRTNAGGLERECVTRYNQAAIVYNSELSQEIQRLNHTLPGSKVVYIDMYTPMIDMIQRPSVYGFEVVNRGCCGTGIYEVTMTCNRFTAPPCEDVSKFLFWDTYHPSERAYNILMGQVIQQYGPLLS